MNFKENQKVELHIPLGHPVDGKHPVIQGRITKLTHGHAIVCFEFITEGLKLAVKPSGQLVVLGKMDELEPEWTQLKVGDIEAIPMDDLQGIAAAESTPAPEWITREQAVHCLNNLAKYVPKGDVGKFVDSYVEEGIIKQNIEGLLRTSDVGFLRRSFPTYCENIAKEQRRFGDEAKEFNRLGSQLHPEIFGKAW